MRSSFKSFRRQRVVGKTAGSLLAASGPRFFFLPTRVGRGGSHFFFCSLGYSELGKGWLYGDLKEIAHLLFLFLSSALRWWNAS